MNMNRRLKGTEASGPSSASNPGNVSSRAWRSTTLYALADGSKRYVVLTYRYDYTRGEDFVCGISALADSNSFHSYKRRVIVNGTDDYIPIVASRVAFHKDDLSLLFCSELNRSRVDKCILDGHEVRLFNVITIKGDLGVNAPNDIQRAFGITADSTPALIRQPSKGSKPTKPQTGFDVQRNSSAEMAVPGTSGTTVDAKKKKKTNKKKTHAVEAVEGSSSGTITAFDYGVTAVVPRSGSSSQVVVGAPVASGPNLIDVELVPSTGVLNFALPMDSINYASSSSGNFQLPCGPLLNEMANLKVANSVDVLDGKLPRSSESEAPVVYQTIPLSGTSNDVLDTAPPTSAEGRELSSVAASFFGRMRVPESLSSYMNLLAIIAVTGNAVVEPHELNDAPLYVSADGFLTQDFKNLGFWKFVRRPNNSPM